MTEEQQKGAEHGFRNFAQANGLIGAEHWIRVAKAKPREFMAAVTPLCVEIKEIAEEKPAEKTAP
jgi:hypothetical protein